MKLIQRFYMGSLSIHAGNLPLKSLNEAIEEAETYLKDNHHCNERYIVEIVRVVKRKTQPIIVEKVN